MSLDRIAFLGLGAMGSRMAARLLDAGFPLTVHTRTAAHADALIARGAEWASSPAEAAQGADLVWSMVTDDQAAETVWMDPERGALLGLRPGALTIESSTTTPGWAQRLATAVQARGGRPLDVPVAGSRPQAEAGRLIGLAGGDPQHLARARPALDAVTGALHHMGPSGMGATFKLAVNAFFAQQVAGLGELLAALGRRGVGPERAAEVFAQLPITSQALAGAGRAMAAGQFDPLFPITLVHKDLCYADRLGAPLPLTGAARASFRGALDSGDGGLNVTGVARQWGLGRARIPA